MIYSIIVCVIFFAAAAVWLIRFVGEAGVKYPKNRILCELTADKSYAPLGETVTARECIKVFLYALIFRLAVFALGWIAYGIFKDGDMLSLFEYCSRWNLWDGPHYIEIAQNGYAEHIEDGQYLMLVFFPLYPLMVRIFHFIIPNYVVSALVVSMLCYAGGCVLIYKLVTIDYSKKIAWISVLFLSIFPFAFFYGSVMTESLFLLLCAATFLAIRRHKWLWAGILGMLAALTRSIGLLLLASAAAEWIYHEQPINLIKDKRWKELGKKLVGVLPVLIMVIGTLIYLYINYRVTGDAFIFTKYQSEHWHMNIQFFGKTLNMIWNRVFNSGGGDWSINASMFVPELVLLIASAVLILYSVRRTRSMYMIYMLVYFAFNAGAAWPLSLSRYLSCMFPAFWILAEFSDNHKRAGALIAAVMAVAFGIYLTGYLTVHQIM